MILLRYKISNDVKLVDGASLAPFRDVVHIASLYDGVVQVQARLLFDGTAQ